MTNRQTILIVLLKLDVANYFFAINYSLFFSKKMMAGVMGHFSLQDLVLLLPGLVILP